MRDGGEAWLVEQVYCESECGPGGAEWSVEDLAELALTLTLTLTLTLP